MTEEHLQRLRARGELAALRTRRAAAAAAAAALAAGPLGPEAEEPAAVAAAQMGLGPWPGRGWPGPEEMKLAAHGELLRAHGEWVEAVKEVMYVYVYIYI